MNEQAVLHQEKICAFLNSTRPRSSAYGLVNRMQCTVCFSILHTHSGTYWGMQINAWNAITHSQLSKSARNMVSYHFGSKCHTHHHTSAVVFHCLNAFPDTILCSCYFGGKCQSHHLVWQFVITQVNIAGMKIKGTNR